MRKTKKESCAHTPFLVRINTTEGKVRPSHVHALAACLESRDRPFCQLTADVFSATSSVCLPLVHSKAATKPVRIVNTKLSTPQKSRCYASPLTQSWWRYHNKLQIICNFVLITFKKNCILIFSSNWKSKEYGFFRILSLLWRSICYDGVNKSNSSRKNKILPTLWHWHCGSQISLV